MYLYRKFSVCVYELTSIIICDLYEVRNNFQKTNTETYSYEVLVKFSELVYGK